MATFRGMVACLDKEVFISLWIMKLLEEQFFHRYIPLGFTEAEEAEIQELRNNLLESDLAEGERF